MATPPTFPDHATGPDGGNGTPTVRHRMDPSIREATMFDSERGRNAVNARWSRYREQCAELEREAKDEAVAILIGVAGEAATQLRALLQADNEHVRLRAAIDILDRLLGKALERHEHAGPEQMTLLRGDIDPETLQRGRPLGLPDAPFRKVRPMAGGVVSPLF